jgi:hypothetical protein
VTERGFYLMHRGWLDHPALADGEFCRRAMWADMIEMAAWRPYRRSINGKTIELQRGEFTASLRFLAARWGCSKAKVERLVSRLKTETMIETRTETGQLVIRICNYGKFQAAPSDGETPAETRSGTGAGHERDSSETKENTFNSLNEDLSPTEREAPKTRRPRSPGKRASAHPSGMRLPHAVLPTEWRTFAQQERPDLDPDRVFEAFKDYWIAKPGKDGIKADWTATWRNWIRKERNNGRDHQDRPGGHRAGAAIAAAASLARETE